MLTFFCRFAFFILLFLCRCFHGHGAAVFTFPMHHRFSGPVRKWSSAAAGIPPPPEKGTFEYYAELADHDRFLRGRNLGSDLDAGLAFSDGNSTFRISSLGFLHYTTVQLGTPGVKFMVALDTGSDLFWVPCDCTRCAATDGSVFASSLAPDFDLSVYSPNGSTTSKMVTCNNSLCTHRNQCPGTFSNCPYMVSYVSAETSTSGILVEDVLHLTKEDNNDDLVEANIIFGCGQVQSGSFLDVAAPNGLFGLGMEKISVPSILSREGFIADSFSMCFGRDGVGRISFGDKGSLDQEETPFNFNPSHPDANRSLIPSVSLTMGGGGHFPVYDPIIIITTQNELVYCLAVVKSAELNIIGQNFMTGYHVVFDREKLILGWKKFDCYDIDDHDEIPTRPHSDTVPPAVAAGFGHYPAPDSAAKRTESSSTTVSPPSHHSHSSLLAFFCFLLCCFAYIFRDHSFLWGSGSSR
ncbi:aspartyl protease family protein 1 isoform X2 [Arachis ipaensis]|uniref:aspartyl protease family protein 1 isoform X2 n=1 Tax=Arachis ipaensis TaxID=130454 RepID=UPI000A2B147D|nr:aspartyl protease family protein 1 isoform X2 [Arachis ipaensis]